jgi:hypothetical protein
MPMIVPASALAAMPESSNTDSCTRPCDEPSRYTSTVTVIAPRNAAHAMASSARAPKRANSVDPKTIISDAFEAHHIPRVGSLLDVCCQIESG